MIGSRLKLARESLGLSLRDLEASIDKSASAQAIGKYERNEMMPSPAVLATLASSLKTTPDYLLSNRDIQLVDVDFRKQPHISVKDDRAVVSSVLGHMERYLCLEELLPQTMVDWHPPESSLFTIDAVESAESAAWELRNLWQLGGQPIPSMVELLEEKGIKVLALNLPDEFSGSKALAHGTIGTFPVIVVNSNHSGERQRFTLAHELAHLVLSCEGADEEKAADRFAGAFLINSDVIRSLLGLHRSMISPGELTNLKRIFNVSIDCLLVRCLQLGIVSKALFGRLWAESRAQGWNSLGPKSPVEVPRRMKRLALRAIAENAINPEQAATLLGVDKTIIDDLMLSN